MVFYFPIRFLFDYNNFEYTHILYQFFFYILLTTNINHYLHIVFDYTLFQNFFLKNQYFQFDNL